MHKFYLEDMVERQMEALEQQNEKLKMSNSFIIDALSTAVEFRNQESGQHIKRIHALAKLLLEHLVKKSDKYAMDADTIETIANASAMHDIGKIAIADAILLKPGRLTPEEFEIMKTHTVKGCEILQSINFSGDPEYYRYCYEICRNHHERWDGTGYPDELVGDEIPLCAQVVSIADVYDALTSERVYKPAFSHEKAISMIKSGECGVFNPDLMDCFLDTAPDYLDTEKIQSYSEPSFTSSNRVLRTDDELVSSLTREQLQQERAKFKTLIDVSGDMIFEYDIPSDTVRFSDSIVALFAYEPIIQGFRHTLLDSQMVNDDFKPVLLNEVLKLTSQTPKSVISVELKTVNGILETFDITLSAVFGNKNSAEKICYIGKLSRSEAHSTLETSSFR
jgi:putative two-component system response regulator